ncbi:DUF6685 family protein [Azohydromonas aeria]|uniref:DUF6685 family protein n=1 Tax=Azohydromonas aeria TaxID=2590212 RepID=UPI0012FA6437|nr:DUF6685 family protein [Azohydromonas aeria]
MLKKGLTLVTGLVRERLGTPPGLRQFLDRNADKLLVDMLDPQPGDTTAEGVPRWHEWGQPAHSDGIMFTAGELLGWKTHRNFGYRSYRVVRPELAGFGSCLRIPLRCNEAQDTAPIRGVRTPMEPFSSLMERPRPSPPRLVDGVGHTGQARLPHRHQVRPLHRQRSNEHLVWYLWDGRAFVIGDDASCDLAAVHRAAERPGRRVELDPELHVFSIEPQAVSSLRRDFELFAVSARDVFASVGFHDALRKSRTPYLSKRMPRPHRDMEVIFLPRVNRRSMALAAEMRAAGYPDVGRHLSTLILRQHMNAARQEARAA